MSRSLEAAIEAARASEVPWDAQRAARIERGIAARRARWTLAAPLARWALGGLASVALFASGIQVSRVIRERGVPAERAEAAAERFGAGAPLSDAAAEPAPSSERPLGDGGFE